MPIQGITGGTGSVMGAAERDYSAVDKLDFMTLLVAQIKNQDPMSPMDNAEFTGQITQFTMLDELESMSATLEENLAMSASLNNTAMLGLVGKNVTVEGDGFTVENGEMTANGLATKGPGLAEIEILDSKGHVVHTFQQAVDKGLNNIEWDGELEDGTMLEDGDYTMSVTVMNQDIEVDSITLMIGPVQGLRYDNNVGVVTVGDEEFYVSEIYQIS